MKNDPFCILTHNYHTDSIFLIHEDVKTLDEAFKRGQDLGKRITNTLFKDPMELQFEKVCRGFIIFSKKHYIYYKFEVNDLSKGKLDAKGVEIVRRDNCSLVGNTLRMCCDYIFKENAPEKAELLIKQVLSDLYTRKVSLKDLLITRSLSRDTDEYSNKQPHADLVERMRTRPEEEITGGIPQVGDRVMYVMVAQGERGLVAEKAEDPLYVLQNDIPYDVEYYVENQIKEPVTRLLTPVIGEKRVAALFAGEHTRKVVKKTSALTKQGVFSSFFTQTYTCSLCGTKNCKQIVCDSCKKRKRDDSNYENLKIELEEKRAQYEAVYKSCQKCQGNDGEVLCLARDCSQLYERIENEKEYEVKKRKLKDIEDLL